MNEPGKHILIVCFGFPPHPGIGGRRWAKFAKYLAKAGYEVHVIRNTGHYTTYTGKSFWEKDIDSPHIHIHDVWCPEIPLIPSKNIIAKIFNRIKLILLHLLSKGSPYDPALFWKSFLHKKAEELIEKYNIHHVIATGAPFRVLYYTALLKKKHPEIFLLCDYRDPWYGAHNYGMNSVSRTRLAHEHAMEATIIETADAITAPSDLFVGHPLREQVMPKFRLLQHAADPDDFAGVDFDVPTPSIENGLDIVYGGALYVGIEKTLIALSKILSSNEWRGPKVVFHIYSPDFAAAWTSELSPDVFRLYPPIDATALMQKIVAAHATMIVLADHNKNFHTTKFFELKLLPRLIFYIGPNGSVSKTIANQNLGYSIIDDNISTESVISIFHSMASILQEKLPVKEGNGNFTERTQELLQFVGLSREL